ncbi:MAG: hypothetical protein Q7S34_01630 [bacterium]|nr:hypothetical protein [bacterium]
MENSDFTFRPNEDETQVQYPGALPRGTFILKKAEKEVGQVSNRELWLIGVALYWGEGSKQKEYYPSAGVSFSNSDPIMIKTFLKWLTNVCEIPREKIENDLYIHESHRDKADGIKKYWTKIIKFPVKNVYFKKNKPNTKRKNIGDLYHGLLRVKVKASTDLNREITGWTNGIVKKV